MIFDSTQTLYYILWSIILLYFIIWFCYSFNKRKLISVLNVTLLIQIFLPLILLYPTTFLSGNIRSTGAGAYQHYLSSINSCFIISMLGTFFFFTGCVIANKNRNKNIILNAFSKSLLSLQNKNDLFFLFLIFTIMFLYMYKQGFFSDLFNGRSYAMGNIDARPIYNLFFSALSLYLLVCMAYIYRKKSKFIIFIAAISTFYALTSGTRGAIMTAILTIIYVYYNINKKASYLKLVMVGLSLIILAIYLGDVRLGQYNLLISMSNAVNGIIFGNNFSDLRDFAWVYSDWNKHFLYGKTFFSGLMSFIPSSMLPWRQQWGLGVFTVETIGYDTSVHPGLRPGIFGESYFNFGILGVCVFGFLYGYAIKRIDNFVRKSIKNESDKNKLVVKVTTGYIVANMAFNFMITAGFFTVYVYLLILIFGYIKFLLRKKFNKTNPPKKIRITW